MSIPREMSLSEGWEYEFVAAAEGISERFMVPALQGSIEAFPFVVKGFHVDNGSEYVNHRVAALFTEIRRRDATVA